jgi:hypothetical protein
LLFDWFCLFGLLVGWFVVDWFCWLVGCVVVFGWFLLFVFYWFVGWLIVGLVG